MILLFFLILIVAIGIIQILAANKGFDVESKTIWTDIFNFYYLVFTVLGPKDRSFVKGSMKSYGIGTILIAIILFVIAFVIK